MDVIVFRNVEMGDDDDDDVWPVLEHQCYGGELAAAPPVRSAGNCL